MFVGRIAGQDDLHFATGVRNVFACMDVVRPGWGRPRLDGFVLHCLVYVAFGYVGAAFIAKLG